MHAAIARCAPSAVKVPAKKYMGNSATAKDECEPAKVLKFYRQNFTNTTEASSGKKSRFVCAHAQFFLLDQLGRHAHSSGRLKSWLSPWLWRAFFLALGKLPTNFVDDA